MGFPRVAGVVTDQGTNISELLNHLADREQSPPVGLTALTIAESGLNEQARRPVHPSQDLAYWPDVSGGLCQFTIKTAGLYGLGDGSPSRQNIDHVMWTLMTDVPLALDLLAQYYGFAFRATGSHWEAVGRYNTGGRWANVPDGNKAHYTRSWEEAQHYLVIDEAAPMVYDPWTPVELQIQNWVCAIRTATWMLRSIGFQVTAGQMQDRMVAAGLVSADSGLLDGSGQAIARWLRSEFGVAASAQWIDWSWLLNHAGQGPIGIGGTRWNHWSAVRAPSSDATQILLANPAPAWHGVGQEMTDDEFAAWGPFSAVMIDVPPEEDPAVIQDLHDQVAALEAQIRAMSKELADKDSYIGALTHDVVGVAVQQIDGAFDELPVDIDAIKQAAEILRPHAS